MRLLLIILLLTSSVFSQEFVKVAETNVSAHYVDKKSIVKTDTYYKFTGKIVAKDAILISNFATDCKNYIVLFEKLEDAEEILTREIKVPEVKPIPEDTPIRRAVNYVCYNTLQKSQPIRAVPETE